METVDNTRTLNSMLDFLPPCFNTDPVKEPAFTVTGVSGAEIEIKDSRLSFWDRTQITPLYEFDLTGKTIGQIVAEVGAAPGYSIEGYDTDIGKYSAFRLLPGISADGVVYMFSSPLWAIYQAFAIELGELFGALKEALRQVTLPGSTGIIQNYWGGYFDVWRQYNETDSEFSHRTIQTIQIPRSNNVAMEELLNMTFGLNTTVIDLGKGSDSWMLMNDVLTPVHNVQFSLWNVGMGPIEPCTFGIVLEDGVFQTITSAVFIELKKFIYAIKESGTRPKLIFTGGLPFMLMNNVNTPMHNVDWPLAVCFQRYNEYYAMFL